jgi:peptide/nickel transport system permease protein
MFAYVVRRVLATIPVMAVVALFVFSLLYIAPGDPAAVIAGDQATPADVERIRASLGLDRPYLVRFGAWVWDILNGNLGVSIFTNLPVSTMIAQRIEPTLSLMIVTLLLAISVAVPMGVVAAWKQGTLIDRAVMAFAVLGFSVPVFVVGYLLAYYFALEWDLLPVQGYTPLQPRLSGRGSRTWSCRRSRSAVRLYRPDRAHHPGDHARGAAAGLHPHGEGQKASASGRSCSCTR